MKAYHMLVTGSSGGGKTTLLREMHSEFNGKSVYMTTKTREKQPKKDGSTRFVKIGATYPADTESVRAWAYEQDQPVQIIVDECQNSGLAKGEGPVFNGLHEDRDRAIKWVPATQDPQDLRKGYGAIKQCQYITWCGPAQTFHKGFLDYYNIDHSLLPAEPYRYVVIRPTIPPEIAYEGTTNESFA